MRILVPRVCGCDVTKQVNLQTQVSKFCENQPVHFYKDTWAPRRNDITTTYYCRCEEHKVLNAHTEKGPESGIQSDYLAPKYMNFSCMEISEEEFTVASVMFS
jgi:hypothetical protein